MTYHSMSEFKQANKAKGGHWFDPDAMQFFRSKIESNLISIGERQFFVTSEQFEDSEGNRDPRKYSLREALPDGDIDTVGVFQGHATKDAAVLAAYETAEVEA